MSQVVLILGAGPRVGASVAAAFAAKNYKVALVSRKAPASPTTTPEGHLSLRADLSAPETIPALFATVTTHLGAAPAVVVWNAAAMTPPPDKESVLSVPAKALEDNLRTNVLGAYVAAQEALRGWEGMSGEEGGGVSGSFIYTGNKSNVAVAPVPMTMTLGVGKAASAYWVGMADAVYRSKGYRFFYADQRTEEGGLAGFGLDGPAHGEFYTQLAEHVDVPWQATFVRGKGYVKFE